MTSEASVDLTGAGPVREVLVDLTQCGEGEDAKKKLGFGLVGATQLDVGDMPGVYVSRVDGGCQADLHVGDQILSVATTDWRVDTKASTLNEVLDHLKDAMQTDLIKLVVASNKQGFAAFTKVVDAHSQEQSERTNDTATMKGTAVQSGNDGDVNGKTDAPHNGGGATSSSSSSSSSGQPVGRGRPEPAQQLLPARTRGSRVRAGQTPTATVTTDERNEVRHVSLGIDALLRRDPESAEEHFATALQITLDDDLQHRMAALAGTGDPLFAQKAWQKELEGRRREKGYVHYLRGVASTHAQRPRDAQLSMLEATRVLLPWYYHPSLLVNLSDADYHHSVSRVLLNKGLYRPAIVAITEARRIRGDEPEYLAEELSFARRLLQRQEEAVLQQQQQQHSTGRGLAARVHDDDDGDEEEEEDDGRW